jgi:non-ribosomal peptide synthetase component F
MLLLATFTLLVHDATGATDLVIGLPVADRGRDEFDAVVGLLMNAVIVRARIAAGWTFVELLEAVATASAEAHDYSKVPYGYLVKECLPADGASPIFSIVYNFVNFGGAELRFSSVDTEPLPVSSATQSAADLSLHVNDTKTALQCLFLFKRDLFSEQQIQDLARRFVTLLGHVTSDGDRRLREIRST